MQPVFCLFEKFEDGVVHGRLLAMLRVVQRASEKCLHTCTFLLRGVTATPYMLCPRARRSALAWATTDSTGFGGDGKFWGFRASGRDTSEKRFPVLSKTQSSAVTRGGEGRSESYFFWFFVQLGQSCSAATHLSLQNSLPGGLGQHDHR